MDFTNHCLQYVCLLGTTTFGLVINEVTNESPGETVHTEHRHIHGKRKEEATEIAMRHSSIIICTFEYHLLL